MIVHWHPELYSKTIYLVYCIKTIFRTFQQLLLLQCTSLSHHTLLIFHQIFYLLSQARSNLTTYFLFHTISSFFIIQIFFLKTILRSIWTRAFITPRLYMPKLIFPSNFSTSIFWPPIIGADWRWTSLASNLKCLLE